MSKINLAELAWSYGGGVQSAAIACLVVDGKLPRPDLIVMADTGREATATWDYLRLQIAPMLANVGLRVEIAPHSLATVDLYAKGQTRPLVPAFTMPEGRLPAYCSVEWKRRVVRRWLRGQGYGPNRPVMMSLGISLDEIERAKDSDVAWITNQYPLLFDVPLRREECVDYVRKSGLPTPPRSSCWCCPQRGNREWYDLKTRQDGDWDRAIAEDAGLPGGLFLHRSRSRLVAADLADDRQMTLDLCDGGYCWT
jgi:hypothetical protein